MRQERNERVAEWKERRTELMTLGRETQQLVDEIGRQKGDGDFRTRAERVPRNSLIQLQQPSGKRPRKEKRKMEIKRGKVETKRDRDRTRHWKGGEKNERTNERARTIIGFLQ